MEYCVCVGYGASQAAKERYKAGNCEIFDRSCYTDEWYGTSDCALRGFAIFVQKVCDGDAQEVLITRLIEVMDGARAKDVSKLLLPLLTAKKKVCVAVDITPEIVMPFLQEMRTILEAEGHIGEIMSYQKE